MPASNFRFDVSSDTRKHFDMAMELAFANCAGGKAERYKIDSEKGLILSWGGAESGYEKLVYKMDLEATKEFVWNWVRSADYVDKSCWDSEVDRKKGFRVYNEAWGHIGSDHYAFVAIKPTFMLYGK